LSSDPSTVYLDFNATSPLRPEVFSAMAPFLRSSGAGNAASLHHAGRRAKDAVDAARSHVAALLNASPSEIFFTSGGTESNVTALRGAFESSARPSSRDTLVVSAVEHPAVLEPSKWLETHGFRRLLIPVDSRGALGEIPVDSRTHLVSVMAANNETGAVHDIVAVAKSARSVGALVHSDAVQVLGKLPIDVRAWDVDLLSGSAHKLGGPQGVGVLFVREGTPLAPLLIGGGQEKGLRSGTTNVAGIVGFGEAARLATSELAISTMTISGMRDHLESVLHARIPGLVVQAASVPRLPNTSSIAIPGTKGEALLMALDFSGFCVSTGSACSSGSGKPSHVLVAMGIPKDQLDGALRISLGPSTTRAHVDAVCDALVSASRHLRTLSGT